MFKRNRSNIHFASHRGRIWLRIIPVIDILDGLTVHAVRGKRKEYKPLRSVLCNSADPVSVAQAFEKCGFGELYIADLDAILGRGENCSLLSQIANETHLALVVDAGVSDVGSARRLFKCGVSKIIVGTETLPDVTAIRGMIDNFGAQKVILSVDLKAGHVVSKSETLASMGPLELACVFETIGVCEMIVLDLDRVGSGEGVDLALLKSILQKLKVRVLVGGGVRDANELNNLKALGVDGVLVATALHSGGISIEDIRRLNSS